MKWFLNFQVSTNNGKIH